MNSSTARLKGGFSPSIRTRTGSFPSMSLPEHIRTWWRTGTARPDQFMDKNHNGKLSVEEFAAGLASPEVTFYKQDKNGDGNSPSRNSARGRTLRRPGPRQEGFRAKGHRRRRPAHAEEYKMPPQQARFRKLDRNHNGFLSLGRVLARHFRQRSQKGGGGSSRQRTPTATSGSTSRSSPPGRPRSASSSGAPTATGFWISRSSGEGRWVGASQRPRSGHSGPWTRTMTARSASANSSAARLRVGSCPWTGTRTGSCRWEVAQGHPDLVMSKHCRAAFAFMDKNHDGKLSVEEFTAGLASPEVTFYKQDKDGDGSLTLAEFSVWAATPEALAAAKRDFEQKDIDGDGRLTLEEFKTPPEQAQFRKLDRNHNGFLTARNCAGTSGKEAAKARRIFAAKDRTATSDSTSRSSPPGRPRSTSSNGTPTATGTSRWPSILGTRRTRRPSAWKKTSSPFWIPITTAS